MKVSVSTIGIDELDVDALVVFAAKDDDRVVRDILSREDRDGEIVLRDFSGKKGQHRLLYTHRIGCARVLFAGLGDAPVHGEALREAGAAAAAVVRDLSVETVGLLLPESAEDAEATAEALVLGFRLGFYRFDRYRTTDDDAPNSVPQRLVVSAAGSDKPARRGAERGRIVAEAVMSARDLVNLSPDEKTPTLLARAFEKAGKKHGFEVSVWDKSLIEDEGMGGLLAVNRGSMDPPTFSVMEYRPDNPVNDRPVVLVGKGVVFDTGGLSLKPTKNSMDAMKSDMSGAAAVAGAMEAVARLELPLHVVALIPATDNRPGENAYVPGDVVRMHSGKTVEVLNTDAEGRMILADALSYARTYSPQLVIDLATLTGSAVVALGDRVAAVMTNETDGAEERLADMVAAGARSGDRVHPLPMFADYAEQLKSTVADMKNVGGREAGSITAGKFLEHFVDYPWIHVDIAGPAFMTAARSYRGIGGTGFGVALLVEFLRRKADPRRG